MEQVDLLKFITGVLEEINVPYMIVGSYASGAYGEPRFTQDIGDRPRIHQPMG